MLRRLEAAATDSAEDPPPMQFDLSRLAERIQAAAARAEGYTVTVTSFDLVISKDGHGTGRSESVPFAALFLREDDVLAAALTRLEAEVHQAA